MRIATIIVLALLGATLNAEVTLDVIVLDVPDGARWRVVEGDGQVVTAVAGGRIAITGGFYDHERKPVGLCVIDGEVLGATPDPDLSGFIHIDAAGQLTISAQEPSAPVSAIQAGPFLIDPGGTLGIRDGDGRVADRCAIAQTQYGTVLLIHARQITLKRLAEHLVETHPEIERALNLDGGPVAGIVHPRRVVENRTAAATYLVAEAP